MVAKNAIWVSLFTFFTAMLGFVSQMVIAYFLGAGGQMDIYFAASALPAALTSIFVNLGSFVLIPIFQDLKIKKGEGLAWASACSFFSVAAIILVVVVSLVSQEAPLVFRSLAPGFDAEQVKFGAKLIPILWGSVLFSGLSALLIGLHNCHGKFAVASFSISFPNIGIILFTLLWKGAPGALALSWGQLCGNFCQLLILLPAVLRVGKGHLTVNWKFPGFGHVAYLALPLLGGGALNNLLPVVERGFASTLEPSSISYLGYAARVAYFFSNVTSIGVATAIFPLLAKKISSRESESAAAMVSISLAIIAILSVPLVIFSPFYSRPLIHLLFERGGFSPQAVEGVARVLPWYAFAYAFSSIGTIVLRAFFASHDSVPPFLSGIFSFGAYLLTAYLLLPRFGYIGLGISTAVFWSLCVTANLWMLRAKVRYNLGFLMKLTFKAGALAGALLCLAWLAAQQLGGGKLWAELTIIVVAGVFYFGLIGADYLGRERHLVRAFRHA